MDQFEASSTGHHVRFFFDPVCPWAWRASLWIREVAKVRPLTIQWGLLALAYVNRKKVDHPMRDLHLQSLHALRLLAKAREIGGEQAIDRVYLALGVARHDQGRELDDEGLLAEALRQANLPPQLLDETRQNSALDKSLDGEYEWAGARGAFGVPSLFIDHSEVPYFGPVIDRVPSGEESGGLWDLVVGLYQLDYFYELKRLRM